MAADQDPATPPQDTGLPDTVERDGFALSSAEDLDEDRLRVDPLEAGMDPPERWTGVDMYGVTPYEQSHPRPLSERLVEEQPDVGADARLDSGIDAERPRADDTGQLIEDEAPSDEPDGNADITMDLEDDLETKVLSEAAQRGQLADEAGGSVASAVRTPDAAY